MAADILLRIAPIFLNIYVRKHPQSHNDLDSVYQAKRVSADSLSLVGERQEAQILKFNAPPPPPPPYTQNAIKQCKWYFLESRKVKDYENVKLVNLSSCTAAQLPLMLCMISKHGDFGVGGNVKFFTEANFILMNTKFTNLNQKFTL